MIQGALFWLCWLLSRPLMWWLHFRTTPEQLPAELDIETDKPVCYVLPERSWLDLFALQRICQMRGLPVPKRIGMKLPSADTATFLYLPILLRPERDTDALEALFGEAQSYRGYDVQLVPVSLFWGRQPDKETSLFRILFSDSVGAGRLHKLFIALFNGRNLLAQFSVRVSLREFMAETPRPRHTMRKLARVFHIHFLRVRTATLGPRLVRRPVLIDGILRTSAVRNAIDSEIASSKKDAAAVRKRARRIANEIAANYSTTTLSFLERLMTPVFNRIFRGIDVRNLERVRQLAQTHEIVFTASHRSHLDYLLISYVLYRAGIVPPHIAAGVNLNFWPIGGLLRRGGAFYIRRSIKGDALYTAIFRAYVDMLIARGYSISFYPEGGRSRTGRLLRPKTGLMAMITESALRQRARKVAVVPIYVGYDRVPEGATYARELRGAQKQKESAQGLLKATKVLTKSFGKPYIAFGEPLRLQEFADQQLLGWRDGFGSSAAPVRPDGFNALVSALAQEIMRRINRAAVASPVAVTSVALLAAPQKAVAASDLHAQVALLLRLLQVQPYDPEVALPLTDAAQTLDWAIPIARLSRIPHDWGDILLAEGKQATLLTYYRNNIQHLFAVPSLIASFFRTQAEVPEQQVLDAAEALYPFLRTEFFLRWPDAQSRKILSDTIQRMVELGLLERDGDALVRPDITSAMFPALSMLSRVMGETLERYCMTAVMLSAEARKGPIERKKFEEHCRSLAERIAVLTGRMAPEFFDRALFQGYLDTLIELTLISETEEGAIRVGDNIDELARSALALLSPEAQQTILQLTAHRQPYATPQEQSV
ncbi:glycerol-3-phosphate 1-O-acyltransferase PlsB [Algiphilus sp. NNCM1]|uniref:glycerol-3-phosphate 1-O-acyltransferase PlsB n=1 Tax=Algiphilus sp. TaxID=1872431 RepID=UPI001CA78F3C|nr:glycerol-3-phosphate 1-O-acyltransferase PlsB [Algiphilus sp.]MBY8965432.1 glycerol-3-phosphate 1-O-acyltransferase PlsB [Algiphilus acroporae]MCI5062411.1 glycerol-3-phosphate 1-O-acyltransferase PlsB [Algiphilus sp.]MCI5104388.1 glycerol-3-phosphate 1-O-acyltransferase PlsB [Algiphilus sp.]